MKSAFFNLNIMTIDTSKATTQQIQSMLLGAIAPRPIAFVATIDADGNHNLSPFSFFNAFSANPPILIFSPARRGRDGSTKHTYENVKEVKQAVVNVVNYDIVQQMSLSSSDFPKGVSEFEKAGFTPMPSEEVKPMRVKESPIQFECEVLQVMEMGTEGGSGNLVICKILKIHISEDILNPNGSIDNQKLKLVGRMGGSDYVKAFGEALFTIPKPISSIGMGFDALPDFIKNSQYLSGNELAQLASLEKTPKYDPSKIALEEKDFQKAKNFIAEGQIVKALHLLLCL